MTDIKNDNYLNSLEFLSFTSALSWLNNHVKVDSEILKQALLEACIKRVVESRNNSRIDPAFIIELQNTTTSKADFIEKDGIELNRKSFIGWVEKMEFGNTKKHSEIDPCLNENHPYYAKELKIAIEAWLALFSNDSKIIHPKRGHKRLIFVWLDENYPKLGHNACHRIATLINPNPKGGAPRSS